MSLNKIVENMGVQCLPVAYPVIFGITYEMNVKMYVSTIPTCGVSTIPLTHVRKQTSAILKCAIN